MVYVSYLITPKRRREEIDENKEKTKASEMTKNIFETRR
jgi:hypothetical protein